MPHKVIKRGNRFFVRSSVSGKILKRSYKTKAAAQARAATSYRRSKRKRSMNAGSSVARFKKGMTGSNMRFKRGGY